MKDEQRVRVKNWTGWSYRKGRSHKERTQFYREFDIAIFSKASSYDLELTGYEIKGWRKDRKGKMFEPAFGDGLDQALVLLQEGADFAYVVYPEPTNQRNKTDLKELCDRYASHIGIIFVANDLSYHTKFREAQRNNHTTRDRKKNMLTSLTTGGNFSDISELPVWVKKQEY